MPRTLRRARAARMDTRPWEETRALPLAAAGSCAAAVAFLVACLLVLLVWPAPRTVEAQGFTQAVEERVKETVAALRTLTLPEFVRHVAARLEEEGVDVEVEGGTTLVLSENEAHFERSSDVPKQHARAGLEAFSRALAWGMNCYVKPTSSACGGTPSFRCEQGVAPFSFSGLEIRGHADAVPFRQPSQERNNDALSLRRAGNAKGIVETCLGEAKPSIAAEGAGSAEPRVRPGEDARNRRVEIRFLP